MSEREPKSLAELVESQKALRIERTNDTGTSTEDTVSDSGGFTDLYAQHHRANQIAFQRQNSYYQQPFRHAEADAAYQRRLEQLARKQQGDFWRNNDGMSPAEAQRRTEWERIEVLQTWINHQQKKYWQSCYRTVSMITLHELEARGLKFKRIESYHHGDFVTVKELPTENIFRRMMMLFFSRRFLELEAKKKSLELDIAALAQQLELTKKKYDMDLLEAKTLISLESEQRIAKINLESQKRVQQLEMENSVKLSELKSGLAKEYYDKMQIAMKDLTLQGSDQSRFVQELSLKMMDKALEKPMPAHYIKEKRVKLKAKNDE